MLTMLPVLVIIFVVLAFLPADDWEVRIGRSIFFLFGAGFSACVGYFGMNLAVKANLRVASAANQQIRHCERLPIGTQHPVDRVVGVRAPAVLRRRGCQDRATAEVA